MGIYNSKTKNIWEQFLKHNMLHRKTFVWNVHLNKEIKAVFFFLLFWQWNAGREDQTIKASLWLSFLDFHKFPGRCISISNCYILTNHNELVRITSWCLQDRRGVRGSEQSWLFSLTMLYLSSREGSPCTCTIFE